MKWFFEDPDRAAALIAEAKTWRGTPFRRGSSAKGAGGGIDCVGLDESLLFAVGAVPKFNFPRDRKRDYSRHVYNDRILKYLRGQFEDPQSKILASRLAELAKDIALMTGDILILKTGVDLYHMPIVLDPPRFIQCAFPHGVSEADITDPQYRDKLVTIFRVLAVS